MVTPVVPLPVPLPQAAAAPALPALIGEILMQRCNLAPEVLDRALVKQREEGGLIGEVLVRMKAIDEDALALALALQAEMPYLRDLPRAEDIPVELIDRLPINFARQRLVLPLTREGGRVVVAVADPCAVDVIDAVGVLLNEPVEAAVVSSAKIIDHINKTYTRLRGGAELEEGKKDDEETEEFASEELVDMLDANDEAPIIRWVNSLMFQAAKDRASDIHIEPGEKDVVVRYRVDGALREAKRAPSKFKASITARVKIMAGLNIAEKRLPQDGRIRRKMAGKDIDMRVATAPTAAGERITIRLLDRSSVLLGLPDIGFANDHLEQIRSIIKRPHGILLVTGPTGSGKTTTLYACLAEINAPDINILTVEDPVEYQLEGISQTQVNSKIDLTFASGLRSFLRHDPDVIMVGEIRDRETAEVAITASLTGHFVFSTVHTNDAAGGITRLLDMGIEPFLVASSLVGLLAQRLVRKPCYECARAVRPSEEMLRELGLDPQKFYAGGYEFPAVKGLRPPPPGTVFEPVGCHACGQLGYRGRTGIYELLFINDTVRRLCLDKADAGTIRNAAVEAGMVSLRFDGARKIVQGMTTPEEVMLMTAEAGD
ncbi:MAG: type II secretion system ATPase GspE [Deltaproteobacteria bacterium]|nr:type II secretion system ATPase GspE [Deltaproteobacteria bacterium]MCW5802424.1 type II secretion system ATPase GspE [Deltaproteobacteria bacterium]